MGRFKVIVDPLFCADEEFVEFDKNCCANCCKRLDYEDSKNDVMTPLGIKIKMIDAISIVFEMAKKLNPTVPLDDNDIMCLAMCSDCHSVFTEMFNSYKKFMKTTEIKSYIRTLVSDCILWEEDAMELEMKKVSDLNTENQDFDHVKVHFEKIKSEDVISNIDEISDCDIESDNLSDLLITNAVRSPNEGQKSVTELTDLHIEKFPLIKVEKLSIEEINSAGNWESFLERGLELSLEQSNPDETTCKWCERKFVDAKLTKTHVDLAHKNISKPFSCQLCDKTFSQSWFQKHHVDVFHSGIELQFICKICDKVYKTLRELNYHKAAIHHENLHPFRCNYCEEGYNEIDELRNHLLERHSNTKEAKAALDNIKYISQNRNLFKTEDLKSTETFLCSICQKVFSLSSARDKHVRYFHDKRTDCVFCDEQFLSVADCKSHETKVHGSYKCPKCDVNFSAVYKLNTHLKGVHFVSDNSNCEACGKSYPDFQHLRQHYKWHKITVAPRQFICKICSKSFSLKHSYDRHMKSHSKKIPKYECLKCKKSYYAKSLLQLHNEKVHGLKSLHGCPSCERTFSTQRSLLVHSRTHRDINLQLKQKRTSEGEFDIMACYSKETSCFICSICDGRVGRKDHFIRHVQRLHTAIKHVPAHNVFHHKCGTCLESFELQDEFLQHLRTKGHKPWVSKSHISLNNSQIEAYECDVCGKFVKGKYHFQKHRNIHVKPKKKVGRKKSESKNKTNSEYKCESEYMNVM